MTETAGTAAPEEDEFDRIVSAFVRHGVEFMVIGGYAVVFHGYVRSTEDLDLFVRPTEANAKRAVAALEAAGYQSPDLVAQVFISDNGISLGEPPARVDVISQLPGVSFEDAWAHRETGRFGSATVAFISRADLIKNKRTVGRPRDLDDARELEEGGPRPPSP